MTKALKKYLLPLCILLISVYRMAPGKLHEAQHPFAPATVLKKWEQIPCDYQDDRAMICGPALSSAKEKRNDTIYPETSEEEISHTDFVKTYTTGSHDFATLFSNSPAYRFFFSNQYLFRCTHWFYASAHRCIALRVIRI
jgi:hypothetical protein